MEKTFAQRARALEKKYKRASYDEIEKKELVEALRKLREEQEEFRLDNDLGGESNEEVEKYDGITNMSSFLPKKNSVGVDLFSTLTGGNSFSSVSTSPLPFILSTGVNLLGNIVGANKAKKNMKDALITAPKVAAEQISLEPERENLRRQSNLATNIISRNARDVSAPGQAYANQIAGVNSIFDSVGSSMASSYMNESNQNAQLRQTANMANTESEMRARLYNSGIKDKYNTEVSQYRDAAFNAIPQGLRDYRSQYQNDMLMNTLGKDYGLYTTTNQNETPIQKLKRMLLGDQYGVYSREYVNSLNGQ